MIAFGLLILGATAVCGGLAVCIVNGIATYLIAGRSRRPVALWTILALAPGINVPASLYFYLTTILRMLDDLAALKMASEFGEGRPKLG